MGHAQHETFLATSDDIDGAGTACGVCNRAVANDTLTHKFLRSLVLGPASLKSPKPTQFVVPGEFAKMGKEMKKLMCTCLAMAEQAFKIVCEMKGTGVQEDTLNVFFANNVENAALIEHLQMMSLCLNKRASQPKRSGHERNAATLEREWKLVGANVNKDNVIGLFQDNVNFKNQSGCMTGQPTGDNYLMGSCCLPHISCAQREAFLQKCQTTSSIEKVA